MTKYLGYGYTNNRGVARLQYAPNGEELTHSGYKNNNEYDTDVTAKFTNKTKEYTSNKKHYPADLGYIFYDNQTTDKRNEYFDGYPLQYVQNGYLYFSRSNPNLVYNTPITLLPNEHWIFEVEVMQSSNPTGMGIAFSDKASYGRWEYKWSLNVSGKLVLKLTVGSVIFDESPSGLIHYNVWYRFKWEFNNGELICSCYDGEDLVYSVTSTPPSSVFNAPIYVCCSSATAEGTKFRNIKIRKLEE